jgi:hypothetical protein
MSAQEPGATPSRSGRPEEPLPEDPAAIERLIDERRRRLAGTVDELVVRAHPKEIARRGAADAKERARAAVTTPDGQLRPERVAAAAAAVVAFLALVVLSRRRRRG